MKKPYLFQTTFFLFIIFFVFVFLPFCKKNDVRSSGNVSADKYNIANLTRSVANSLDLPASKVVFDKKEEQFIIDGDGFISLEDAKARFTTFALGETGASNEATQRRYNYIVSLLKVSNIKIFADNTVSAAWVSALDSAIKIWNASGSKVYLQRVTTLIGSNTLVTTTYNTATNIIASAGYPDLFGSPGKKIIINTHYNSLSPAEKIASMIHEVGHSLGLMHTNETSGTLISGTPALDANSVMNSVCVGLTVLTPYDLVAIRYLYPR